MSLSAARPSRPVLLLGALTLALTPLAVGSHPATAAAPDGTLVIDIGVDHSLVIGADAMPYGAGDNHAGQLTGGPPYVVDTLVPLTGLPDGVTAVDVASGGQFSLVLGSDGIVYGAGANDHHQVGPGEDDPHTLTPVSAGAPVGGFTSVAASRRTSYATGADGNVYGVGQNLAPILGPASTDKTAWTLIPKPADVAAGAVPVELECTFDALVARYSDGTVYGIGDNGLGVLTGADPTDKTVLTPFTGLPDGVEAVDIGAGASTTLVVGSDGVAYATGDTTYGQAGSIPPEGVSSYTTLTPMTGLPAGVDAVAGDVGLLHSLVAGSDGNVYAAGRNTYGNLGFTADNVIYKTLQLATRSDATGDVTAVGVSDYDGMVATDAGTVLGAGRNDNGLLTASGQKATFTPFTGLPGEPPVVVPAGRPTISGSPKVGNTLAATVGAWVPDGSTLTYQWKRAGAVVGTAKTRVVTTADVGKSLTVTVTVTPPGGEATPRTSDPIKAIAVALRWTRAKPVVGGAARVGRRLSVSGAPANGFSPAATRLTYQWLRGSKPIAGATDSSYLLKSADVGKKLSVRVTGQRAGYLASSVVSKPSGVVRRR
jgi:alpha-tubulin suppressor-like RCC1 family protein